MTDYYVDALIGDNGNDGLTPGTAWQSSFIVNTAAGAGDTVHYHRDQRFELITLRPLKDDVASTPGTPLHITAYDEGPRPVITAWWAEPYVWTVDSGTIYSAPTLSTNILSCVADKVYLEPHTGPTGIPLGFFYFDLGAGRLRVNIGEDPTGTLIEIIDGNLQFGSVSAAFHARNNLRDFLVEDIEIEGCYATAATARAVDFNDGIGGMNTAIMRNCLITDDKTGHWGEDWDYLLGTFFPDGLLCLANNLTVENCEFYGWVDAINIWARNNVHIYNCYVHSPKEYAFGTVDHVKTKEDGDYTDTIIEQCVFEGYEQDAIDAVDDTIGLIIRDCYFLRPGFHQDNLRDGITAMKTGATSGCIVERCLFENVEHQEALNPSCTSTAGRLDSNCIFRDNSFVTSTQVAALYDGTPIAANTFLGNTAVAVGAGPQIGDGDYYGGSNMWDGSSEDYNTGPFDMRIGAAGHMRGNGENLINDRLIDNDGGINDITNFIPGRLASNALASSLSRRSQESQDVIDRMEDLSPTEEEAIIAFVDSQVASGNWANMDEFWCFALNATDYLTGWLSNTAIEVGNVPRGPNGAEFPAGGLNYLDSNIIFTDLTHYTLQEASIGSFCHSMAYTGVGDSWLWGIDSGSSVRMRQQGSDGTVGTYRINHTQNRPIAGLSQPDFATGFSAAKRTNGASEFYLNGNLLDQTTHSPSSDVPVTYTYPIGTFLVAPSTIFTVRDHIHLSHFVGGGNMDIDDLYTNLLILHTALGVTPPDVTPPISDEAQAVLNRMTDVEPGSDEESAIITFVDSQVDSGNWDLIDEFFCFALNNDNSDWLTGWKEYTAEVSGNAAHSPNGFTTPGIGQLNHLNTTINLADLDNYTQDNASAGIYVHEWNYTGNTVSHYFGTRTSAIASTLFIGHHGVDDQETETKLNRGAGLENVFNQEDVAETLQSTIRTGGITSYYVNDAAQPVTTTDTSVGLPGDASTPVWLGQLNDGGDQLVSSRNAVYTSFFVGGGDIDITDFYNNLVILHASLGVS